MTRMVKITQEGVSAFLQNVPEEIQEKIFELLDLQDRLSLACTCKYVQRLLQRRLIWKSLGTSTPERLSDANIFSYSCLTLQLIPPFLHCTDFPNYFDLLQLDTVRLLMEAHLTKLTHLAMWSPAHNFDLLYRRSKRILSRYSNLEDPDPFSYWDHLEYEMEYDAATLHMVPKHCRQLKSLEANCGDITVPWLMKTLTRNSSLTKLSLPSGLVVPDHYSASTSLDARL